MMINHNHNHDHNRAFIDTFNGYNLHYHVFYKFRIDDVDFHSLPKQMFTLKRTTTGLH